MSLRHLFASVLLFTALLACQGAETGQSDKASQAKKEVAPETTPAEPATKTVEPSKAIVTGEAANTETDTGDEEPAVPVPDAFEKVGVDVCDQYVADYVACIDTKMPEAGREAARRSVFENITVWKQTAAGGPSGQKSLQTACHIAREQAKRGTANLGCEW